MLKRIRIPSVKSIKRVRVPPRWSMDCIGMLRRLSIKWSLLLPKRSILEIEDLFQEACMTANRITPKWRGNRKRTYSSFIWFVANRDLMTIVKAEWKRSALEFVELEQQRYEGSNESFDCSLERSVMVKEALSKMAEISQPFVNYIINGDGLPDEIMAMAEMSRRIRAGTRLKRAKMLFSAYMFESYYGIDLEEFKSIFDEYVA